MAKNTWILLILAIVCLQAYGIYEHEVGRNEWFIQTLGGEIYDSHSPKDYPHLLLTISKKILTGVNQETGKIIWRKELVDTGCHSMKVFDDYVLIKGKNSIQVFTIGRGELVTSLNSQNAISDAALVVKDDGKKVPIIVFSEKEGETLAYINAKKHASQETSYLGLNVDHSGALIGISHNGKSHELYKIDPETLKATVINKNIKIADKLGPRVWYKSTRKFFAITDFEGKSIVSLNKVYFTGSVERVEDVEGLTFRDLAHTSKNIFAPFAKSNNLGSPFLLKVSDATLNIFKKGELVATLNEVNYQKSGDILRVFLHDKAFLVQMKDLSLHYISKEGFNRKWKREESLANIDKFKFLDITESFTHHDDVADFMKKMDEMGDSIAKVPVKILSRYTFHIQRLFSFVTKLGDLVFNENLFSKKDDVHTRDTFGFKKLIIGLSKNHDTLVCLQSNNGQLLWTLHFTKFLRDAGSLRNEKDELTFSDFHLIEKEGDDNEAVVLISTKQGNTLLITVDPYAGTIKDTRLYSGHQTTHSFKLHLASLHEVILLIDEKQMKTQFYPKIENPKINSDPTNLDFFNGMASMTHSFVHKVDINVDSEIGNIEGIKY